MSSLLRSFYHNLKEPIIICDMQAGTFYQNKAAAAVFGEIDTKGGIKALKKIDYGFHFDYCLLKSDDIRWSLLDETIYSKNSFTTFGTYQNDAQKVLYFVIKGFSVKRYRIIYFYDCTKEFECEKILEKNEKLKLQNQKFANTNSKAQNQAVKMALLNRISTNLSKTLNLDKMAVTVLSELSIITGASKLYFAKKVSENEFKIEYVYPLKSQKTDEKFFYNDEIINVLKNGKNHTSPSLKEHDNSKMPYKTAKTRIIMPMINQNELFGAVIIFTNKKKISEIENELLVSISMQISNVVTRVNMFNEINLKKEELQKTLNELKETQLQLINSEKMASLGQLIASVAHEINTPLASISANSEILKKLFDKLKDKIDPSVYEIFKDINSIDFEAIKRITNLVQSLKRFVRLDETVLQKADINKELDLTLEILKHKTKKGIEIIKNYGRIKEIECYPNMLNQVFLNILMNGIQSIEKQKSISDAQYKGEIEILTKEENGFLVVKITDNGFGISDEDKQKIFQAGFTTKKVGEGTGLGLAICKKIVEKHNGKITFNSKILKNNKKTTNFTIFIPVLKIS